MLQLNYKEYGQNGPVLLILHGFLGSLDNWHTLATEWGNNGFHVFTIDLRNHGRSPHTESHSIELMAEDLKDFMQQHNLSSANILGHSMGGKVAMQFALTYPEMTDKLIVADMSPRQYKPGHDDVFNAIQHVDLSRIESRKEAEQAMMPYLGDYGTRQFILKNLDRSETGSYRWKFNFDTLYRDYESIIREITSDHPFAGDTLFIKGSQSLYIQDKDLPFIKQLFPQASVTTVENAGHWIHADQPRAFFEVVKNFVNK